MVANVAEAARLLASASKHLSDRNVAAHWTDITMGRSAAFLSRAAIFSEMRGPL